MQNNFIYSKVRLKIIEKLLIHYLYLNRWDENIFFDFISQMLEKNSDSKQKRKNKIHEAF